MCRLSISPLQFGSRYTATMAATSTQIWDAIYHIGAEDLAADNIPPAVITKLVEFKMATVDTTGFPQLTPYGAKCFSVLITGDGVVPELNDMAAMEDQQRPGNGQRVE